MNDLTIYDRFSQPGQLIEQLGKAITLSGMFGCDSQYQGQVLALECAARKCPPMSLAERYHIIHGRLSMKADAMLADFRQRVGGSHRVIERSADRAAIELTAGGQTEMFSLTWKEARQEPFVYQGKEAAAIEKLAKGQAASLQLKPKYATPRSRSQLLWARVVSDGVRTMAPEVVAGYYTPEEIADYSVVSVAAEEDGQDSQGVQDAEVVEPPSQAEKKPGGVKLSGKQASSPHEKFDSDPAGDDLADTIKAAARQLGVPPEKLREIVARHGVGKLAEIPVNEAEKLLARLRHKLLEANSPF